MNSKGKIEEGQASFDRVTIQEAETGSGKTLKTSESREGFQRGPVNGKFLKFYFP